MNTPLRIIFLCPVCLALATSFLYGQNLSERHHDHLHTSFQQIEEDFQKGQLNLDQKVLYKILAVYQPQELPGVYRVQDSVPDKCGTPAVMEFYNNRTQLSAETIRRAEAVIGFRQQSTESYISPSGRFSVEYDTTGTHAVPPEDENQNNVPDYVEQVGAAADSSYRHEVVTLGYTNPISNGGIYTIEIRNLPCGPDCYGFTGIEDDETYIRMENDFEGFPDNTDPEGDRAGAVKVTIAHELKHAIQYEATGWRGETDRWAEMDATLMEEVVYDNVNDYYNYLHNPRSIFNSPETSFNPGSYYHVSWALYFEEQYGPYFWPGVWDIIEANPEIRMVEALRRQLVGESSFHYSFTESLLWHYASGEIRDTGGYGFEESRQYPNPSISVPLSGLDSLDTDIEVTEFAANFIEFTPAGNREGYLHLDFNFAGDSAGIGLLARLQDGTYEARISAPGTGEAEIWTEETNWQWNEISRLGIVIANSSEADSISYTIKAYPNIPEQLALVQNYPNPFSEQTTIEYSLPENSDVQLKIYDTTGRLVRTLRDESMSAGFYEETFDGSNLASGIYFYQLITNEQNLVKQMVLIK